MWCLRLLLLVVLLPWSSSVKREHTPAGTPLISESFGEVSSAPADAVSSATPTSPLPPCRLIDETGELPATETPATPMQDVTRDKFRRRLHLSGGGTTAWTPCGTEALQHVEKNCRVKVEGETTKVKRSLFSYYHPNDGPPSRHTMFQRARRNALSEEKKQELRKSSSSSSSFSISTAIEVAAMASYITMSAVATIASWLPTVLEVARLAYIAQRNSWDSRPHSLWLTELPARATPEFQFKERFLVS